MSAPVPHREATRREAVPHIRKAKVINQRSKMELHVVVAALGSKGVCRVSDLGLNVGQIIEW